MGMRGGPPAQEKNRTLVHITSGTMVWGHAKLNSTSSLGLRTPNPNPGERAGREGALRTGPQRRMSHTGRVFGVSIRGRGPHWHAAGTSCCLRSCGLTLDSRITLNPSPRGSSVSLLTCHQELQPAGRDVPSVFLLLNPHNIYTCLFWLNQKSL